MVCDTDDHRREVAELQAKINLLLAMSSLADTELKKAVQEAAEARANLAEARANLNAILVSTSWKISAPLRWLKEKIGS